jgi:peptidoglycan/LPS O-acetylase OafA/YrhL
VTETNATRLTELDALRGLAALAVVLFHYLSQYQHISPIGESSALSLPWGRFGVEIFFGISGFVIFMTLRNTRTATDFIVSRFARLFPAYWAAIIVTTGVVHLCNAGYLHISAGAVAVNFTMLQGHLTVDHADGAYWSLSVELGFYAIMLFLWRLKLLDRIEWALIAWIALKLLWWLFPGLSWRLGYILIIEYIPFFAVGVSAFRIWSGERRWIQQLPLLAFGYFVVILIDPWPMTLVYPISLAIFAAIASNKTGFLRQSALIWLGSISYPLYLIHQYAGFAIMDALQIAKVSPLLAILITLALVLCAAWLINRFIERPALRLIRNMWRNRADLLNRRTAEPASQ